MKKCVSIILAFVLSVLMFQALAEINWAEMTDEEIRNEIELAKAELASRHEAEFVVGKPIRIEDNNGSYLFTMDDVIILDGRWEDVAKEKGDDCYVLAIRGVCENLDWTWMFGDAISTYMMKENLIVSDQDGFSLEPCGTIIGEGSGRYEVGVDIEKGTMKRVALLYYVYHDTTSIFISIPNHEGTIEIDLEH